MKNIFIPILIIINLVTVYFWLFPYQSNDDISSLRLANQVLKKQNAMISTSNQDNIGSIQLKAKAYPKYSFYENQAKRVHEEIRNGYNDLEILSDNIIGNFGDYIDLEIWHSHENLSFWNRIRPFHYQIPKKVLFHNHELESTLQFIQAVQDSILVILTDDNLKQSLQDSFFINTETLPNEFKKTSIYQAVTMISTLQNQVKLIERHILQSIVNTIDFEFNNYESSFDNFVPMISKRQGKIKVGETFEAEIYLNAYSNNKGISMKVDGKSILVKNGIGTYTFTTKSKITEGEIEVKVDNLIYEKPRTYQRSFEIDVSDCN